MNAADGNPFDWHGRSEADVRPACHPDAPMWAKINRQAQITLTCARCGQVFLKMVGNRVLLEETQVRSR